MLLSLPSSRIKLRNTRLQQSDIFEEEEGILYAAGTADEGKIDFFHFFLTKKTLNAFF